MSFSPISFIEPTLDGISHVVNWFVSITSIPVGVILFTLALKLLTLGFDFWSRKSMRRNSLKMEEMRPELEKLQKQYANDKVLYNQKMQALYKKNGYSMMGACLPTIITLVIFIFAFGGLTGYANYKKCSYYYEMSNSYNSVIYDGIQADGNFITKKEDGSLTFKIDGEDGLYNLYVKNANKGEEITVDDTKLKIVKYSQDENQFFDIYSVGGYVKYNVYYTEKDGAVTFGTQKFISSMELLKTSDTYKNDEYVLNYDLSSETADSDAKDFVRAKCRVASANKYEELSDEMHFLWIKNIWIADSPLAHPVEESNSSLSYSSCNACTSCGTNTAAISESDYKELTYNLTEQKSQVNGYFIFAVLNAAVSLALQLISMKSQKAQMELQTVDGQGAQSQKMMLWMMPIIMFICAFSLTSVFSIYMIMSSIFSIASTLVINAVVDKQYKKETAKKDTRIRGRVFVPDETLKKKPEKKKKKEDLQNDFLVSKGKLGKFNNNDKDKK